MGEWVGRVGESHRPDELRLEVRCDRDLNVLNGICDPLGLDPRVAIDQRDPRAVAGRVSNGCDLIQVAIRNHTKNHSVLWTDEATKGPGQENPVDVSPSRRGEK